MNVMSELGTDELWMLSCLLKPVNGVPVCLNIRSCGWNLQALCAEPNFSFLHTVLQETD